MNLGDEYRIPVMRANTLEDVLNDPHLKSVDFFQLRQHPTEGAWRTMRPLIIRHAGIADSHSRLCRRSSGIRAKACAFFQRHVTSLAVSLAGLNITDAMFAPTPGKPCYADSALVFLSNSA
jgi:hypothetical protein